MIEMHTMCRHEFCPYRGPKKGAAGHEGSCGFRKVSCQFCNGQLQVGLNIVGDK